MPFGYAATVQLLRETVVGTDEYGNDVRAPSTVAISGCAIWPSDGNAAGPNERLDAADIVTTGYTVLMPAGTTVQTTDRVQLPDDPTVWEVTGLPVEWRSPFTSVRSGVQVTLRQVR